MLMIITNTVTNIYRGVMVFLPQPRPSDALVSAILEGVTFCLMIIHSHLSLSVPPEELCGGYTGIHACVTVSFEGLDRVHSLQLFFLTVSVILQC